MFLHEVALAPEGRRVVSTEPDGTLRVWEIDTGREWSTLTAHSRQAHCVSVTSDGRWAVSAEGVPYDGEVKVWDLDSGREIASLPMHSFQSAALSVTPRWRRVVMASGHDRRLKVWDLDDGRVYPLAGHSRQVHTVTITAHGRLAVSGGLDGTLRVWDIEAGAGTPSLNGHTKSIEELAVLPDGRIAVSASADETLKVWDFETGLELYTHSVGREHRPGYSAYRNWGLSIAATEKGGRAIFFCADGTLRIVDLNSATELRSLKHGHDDPLYLSLAITPDVRLAVTAGEDATKVWDLEHGHELRSLPGLAPMHVPLERFRADLRRIALTPDGRHAIFAQTEALVVRDLFTGDDLLTLRCPAAVEEVGARLVPNCLFWALSENGRRAIVVSKHAVTAWDLRNGRELQTFAGGTDWLDRVAATADLRRVLISTAGGALEVLDLDAGRRLHLLRGHTDAVLAVAIAADGRRGFSGSRDMTVRVWDLEQGVLESTFTTDAQVTNIASDAAGWKLCAGDWRGGIHLLALEEVGA